MNNVLLLVVLFLQCALPVMAQYRTESPPPRSGTAFLSASSGEFAGELSDPEGDATDTPNFAWQPWDIPTVGAQILGGTVGAAVIGVPLFYLPKLILTDAGVSGGGMIAYGLIGLVGLSYGLTEGIMLAGDLRHGSGKFGPTFAGSISGLALGAVSLFGLKGTEGQILAPILALGLPIYCYHASATPVGVSAPVGISSATSLLPLERPGSMQFQLCFLSISLDAASTP